MTLPGVLEIEQATLAAVPAPRIAFVGPFVVRAFHGGTGRANAACSLDPSHRPTLADEVASVRRLYGRLGVPARIRSTPLDPVGLTALLCDDGWHRSEESLVICGRLGDFARADAAVTILHGPEADWLRVVATAEHQVPARQREKLETPALLAVAAAWLVLHEGGTPAASAFVAVQGRLAGLFDLAVVPEFRRSGLGRRVMAAAAAWALSQGASFAYAQVAATNTASLALNAGLGLREAYRYRYMLR
jgi:GNAT superfamily N-acetyltransferase